MKILTMSSGLSLDLILVINYGHFYLDIDDYKYRNKAGFNK